MMDFISIPLVVGMITLGIYNLFELFVHKKERLNIIDKIGEKFDASMIENRFSFPGRVASSNSYISLKIGCLLIGLGLGLLVGFFISTYGLGEFNLISQSLKSGNLEWDKLNQLKDIVGIIYGACVFLFGGLGLLGAFMLEMKYLSKKQQ
jgi:hypothetical protein